MASTVEEARCRCGHGVLSHSRSFKSKEVAYPCAQARCDCRSYEPRAIYVGPVLPAPPRFRGRARAAARSAKGVPWKKLLAELQEELSQHAFSEFPRQAGADSEVVTGCANCRKSFQTANELLEHLTKEVLPAAMQRLETMADRRRGLVR